MKIIDNSMKYNLLIKRFYESIFKLDTETLNELHIQIFKELCSREDYVNVEDLKVTYEILKDELIERGVTHV